MYETLFHSQAEIGIQNALLAVLANLGETHPAGITGVEVAKHIGLGVDSAKSKLRELRRRGEIDVGFHAGNLWLWMTPDDAKAFVEAQRESDLAKAREGRKRRYREEQEAKQREADNDDLMAPVQRIVPAHMAPPIRCSAPRWVFECGMAA